MRMSFHPFAFSEGVAAKRWSLLLLLLLLWVLSQWRRLRLGEQNNA